MTVLYANPLRDPGSWNKIIVSGVPNPGVFKLNGGGDRTYRWDNKETAGAQGQTSTYTGWKASDGIRGSIQMWTAEQIDEFVNVFMPIIRIDATKKEPKPLSVLYAPLMLNAITAMNTVSIGPLSGDERQLWSVEVEWAEYRPAAKKNVTVTPLRLDSDKRLAAQNRSPVEIPTVQDAQDLQIVQLATTAGFPIGGGAEQFRVPGNPSQ